MAQVAFEVNGRTYQLACKDGEEARLQELAGHVAGIVDRLAGEFGQIAPERLMLMAAILTADELWDARERLSKLSSAEDPAGRP
ncbi:MAG: cell division protein ZapA [Pseudomonadota bacterium]